MEARGRNWRRRRLSAERFTVGFAEFWRGFRGIFAGFWRGFFGGVFAGFLAEFLRQNTGGAGYITASAAARAADDRRTVA